MRAIFCVAVLKNMYSRFSDQLWHILTAHIFVWLCVQTQNSVYDMCVIFTSTHCMYLSCGWFAPW